MSDPATIAPSHPPKRPRAGGRVKGTPNKKTRLKRQEVINALIAETLAPDQVELLQPLEVMLRVMRARVLAGDDAGALVAAAACAPYCHARLSSSDLRITNTMAAKTDEERLREAAELEARMAAARVVN